ncbi:MAG: NAD(P)H-dependent oxidoreductase [Thermodesulfobacteriota bacterium]|nr:NAD(P)H-dependent oxidoreductase [Thermodesulfobacteriota bacterium]
MKILALQGSPRPKKYTQMVLEKFLEGAVSKGAKFEIIHLANKRIHPCIGCYTCWYKTPGVCIHKDDMPELLEKLKSCDVEVWATPLYHYGMTAYMKLFLERTLPLVQPYLTEIEGVTTHPSRYPGKRADKMVLISVCGFPEVGHFDALVENFRLLARAGRRKLAGVLLRPGAESMLFIEKLGKKGEEVLHGFYRAGQEIVEKGEVSKKVEEIVSQEWTKNRRGFQEQANLFWKIRLEFEERALRGEENRPFEEAIKEDIRILLGGMAVSFRGEAAGDLRAMIQFDVTGRQAGQWYFEIADGYCAFGEGKLDHPTLIIHTPSEVWVAISKGELDGAQAFMEKKYSAEGDLSLLLRLNSLFGNNR